MGLLIAGLGSGLLIALIVLATSNTVGDADSTAAVGVVNGAFSIGIFLSPFFQASLPRVFGAPQSIQFNFILSGVVSAFFAGLSLVFTIFWHRSPSEND